MGVQNQRKIQNKMKFLKKLKQIYNTSPVLQDKEVRQHLEDPHHVLSSSTKNQATFFLIVKNSIFLGC